MLTETPPNGVILNGATLNLQDGTLMGVNGNVINQGSIITGNGVAETGLNSLNVTGVTTTTGVISLNANGDSFTTGGLVNSGSVVVNAGTSLVDTGSFTNSGSVYFGKLQGYGTPNPVLTEVFYIISRTDSKTNAVSNILMKRGKELHAPDRMYLNPASIVFIETVGPPL